MSDNPFGPVGTAEYVQLTTFTRDGRRKPVPIWAALDRGELLMWTQASSWKVKRIRNTPGVTVAKCDRTGKNAGPEIEATARILDAAGTDRARAAVNRKYGLVGTLLTTASRLFRGKGHTIGIAVTAS